MSPCQSFLFSASSSRWFVVICEISCRLVSPFRSLREAGTWALWSHSSPDYLYSASESRASPSSLCPVFLPSCQKTGVGGACARVWWSAWLSLINLSLADASLTPQICKRMLSHLRFLLQALFLVVCLFCQGIVGIFSFVYICEAALFDSHGTHKCKVRLFLSARFCSQPWLWQIRSETSP